MNTAPLPSRCLQPALKKLIQCTTPLLREGPFALNVLQGWHPQSQSEAFRYWKQ